jgi:RNA-directed DNA polymerase
MKTLFDEVRSEQNIFSAWRHVKRSALASGSSEIKGQAAEFDHTHQTHLKRIITQLREGRFVFDPVQGVLKDKQKRLAQNKDPRPIAIATLGNRVVQRAILQVLQPRKLRDLQDIDSRSEAINDPRLGRINSVNRSKFGVGGLIRPYGGVRPAIETIMTAMDAGAKYYYQSDIKSFFTKIQTPTVVDFIRAETGDLKLVELFSQAMEVRLGNPEELKGFTQLFPSGGIGVAQGASLSAFAGNVLLYDLDHKLNSMGVTCVRYIDDILMVSDSEQALEAAVKHAETVLTGFGFGLYTPADGPEKAARGNCADAIDFLGCTIQPKRCVPSKQSIKNMRTSVTDALSQSKSAIKEGVTRGRGVPSKLGQATTLHTLASRIYGWQKSFAFCNQAQPFEHLDKFVCAQVLDYQNATDRMLKGASPTIHMSGLGIPSTREMFEANRSKKES